MTLVCPEGLLNGVGRVGFRAARTQCAALGPTDSPEAIQRQAFGRGLVGHRQVPLGDRCGPDQFGTPGIAFRAQMSMEW